MKNRQEYLRLQNISKSFGSVLANDDVSLSFCRGEIHAILGENGSGKSTLMNILSGIYTPDSGNISIDGVLHSILSPREALALGIGMIHQHFKLVDSFTATENIIAGRSGSLFLDSGKDRKIIKDLCLQYGFSIEPDKKVQDMSISERQMVEILKALYRGADVLILDEPTAVLTPQEIESLFAILENMRKLGCLIILISHKLQEVLSYSNRVTVLRKGRYIATVETERTNASELAELMIGHVIDLDIPWVETKAEQKTCLVEVDHISVLGPHHKNLLDDVSFSIFSHEILGIAGIAGSGQKELCEVLSGMRRVDFGTVILKEGHRFGTDIGFVPEDRLGMGLAGGLNITDNILLRSYRLTPGPFVDRRNGRKKAHEIVDRYSISTPGIDQVVKRLSGGNIQKVLLGREIDRNPIFLITAYPVRGLDVGSSQFIYGKLNEEKQKGVAVLFVGEDLDVLLAFCDRIAVLFEGRLMGIFDTGAITKEAVGMLMMGCQPCSRP
ncbi:ABC transporter ATP-binding protein [uncultured Sphaerochaeta sp.]|uniref:ABC transporter ATP-binding protein n=1 Tax=uncultured Sphaerochaeta sp. TaxID=886478 RepID=UPI002A0A61BA|nr:ABC transporter ATP-binding protein [uncultured Sphaerochaeta sp.]